MKSSPYSKKLLLLILILIIYLLWHTQILDAFDNVFSKPILGVIKNNPLNSIVFFCLYELTVIAFILWYQTERKMRNEVVLISIFILLNYLWFRFFNLHRYNYVQFYNTPIFYSDYLIFLFAGIIFLRYLKY